VSATLEVTTTVTLVPVTCCDCGVVFGLSREMQRQRRDDNAAFFCPNGHSQPYRASALDAARDALAREKYWREQAERESERQQVARRAVQRRLSATQGVLTRNKRKVAAGQCPCCTATFKNLKSHMQRAHPHWDVEREVDAMDASAAQPEHTP